MLAERVRFLDVFVTKPLSGNGTSLCSDFGIVLFSDVRFSDVRFSDVQCIFNKHHFHVTNAYFAASFHHNAKTQS